jgi:beta-lactamase regulating signal transducer with metallopeptidase domain
MEMLVSFLGDRRMATEFIPVAIAQFWQVTLLILVVGALSRWLSPRRPHLSHLLWLVVLIKCVTPPLWASSGGVFCWLQPEQQIDTPLVEHIEWTPVTWDAMLEVEDTSLVNAEVSDAPFAGVYLDEASAAELTADSNVVESASDEQSTGWRGDAAFAAWLAISCLVLLGVTIRWLRFWRLVRASPRRDSPELDTMLQTLSKQLGVRRRVRLIVTESLVGPAVVGFFRVTVLIPSVVADKLKGESVAPILAHELLHVRRGDLWVGLLQTVAQALWWFHPLVWWVGRVTSREAERCCDEEVLGELKCDPASYARALLDVLDLKSQLKPVPVFPGVRSVDVTSQRLERIMSLRQGCRRRSPLWCWLVAIGAAALTLPGAAFVVTAQEEEPTESTTNEEPRTLPAPPAYVGPGPFSPMPLPQDTELTAYAFGKGNDTAITEVYDVAEFMPLLSGSESEQQRKFERLVKSRDPAHDAQINWFNGRPVVKTTSAGHAAVRQCIDLFIGSGATSETIDAFVGSVSTQLDETLICDLQVISVSDDAYSKLEDIALEHSKKRPWVVSADTWDAAVKSVDSDETFHFLAPRCAVFNGRTITVNSGGEHPVSFKREDDGGLILGKNWSGWKTQLLPFVRNDGTFWLGVSFENGRIVGKKSLSPKQAKQTGFEGATTIHEYQQVEFSTTLKEGQLVVLPGFTIAYDHKTPRATLMTARVRQRSTKSSPKAVASPQQLSGTGVNSDAGITGNVQLTELPEAQATVREKTTSPTKSNPVAQASASVPNQRPTNRESNAAGNGQFVSTRNIGPLTLAIAGTRDSAASSRILVTIKTANGQEVLAGTADDVRIHSTVQSETVYLQRANLTRNDDSPAEIIAERLAIEFLRPDEKELSGRLTLKIENGRVRIKTGSEFSNLKAQRIEIILNPEPFRVNEVSAEGLGSLRTSHPDLRKAKAIATSSQDKTAIQQSAAKEPESWESVLRRRALKSGRSIPATRSSIAMETKVSTRFSEVPLSDVIDWARKIAGLNIVVDRGGIEEEGVTLSTPVSIELNDVSLQSVFKLVLEPLNLGFKIEEESGIVVVFSKLRQAGTMIAAAYPVADLVVPRPGMVTIRRKSSEQPTAKLLKTPTDRSLEFDQLVELIHQTVEPDSWQEVGGWGTIRTNETTLSLVIRTTQDVHREISDLLDQLRRLQDIQVSLQMQTLELPKAFLADWNDGLEFEPLSDAKLHRYVRLSGAQADELRRAGNSSLFPKVTLFNGQLCELRMDEQDGIKQNWHLQPVVSGDRRSVRLGVGIDDGRSGTSDDAVPTSVTTVSDDDAILVEVNESTDKEAPIVGEPIPGQPRAFRQVSQPRRFVLIQPKVVIVEEEELLGIDVGK